MAHKNSFWSNFSDKESFTTKPVINDRYDRIEPCTQRPHFLVANRVSITSKLYRYTTAQVCHRSDTPERNQISASGQCYVNKFSNYGIRKFKKWNLQVPAQRKKNGGLTLQMVCVTSFTFTSSGDTICCTMLAIWAYITKRSSPVSDMSVLCVKAEHSRLSTWSQIDGCENRERCRQRLFQSQKCIRGGYVWAKPRKLDNYQVQSATKSTKGRGTQSEID